MVHFKLSERARDGIGQKKTAQSGIGQKRAQFQNAAADAPRAFCALKAKSST